MALEGIMTRQIETVAPSATLSEAAKKMKERDIGSLIVRNDEKVMGFVTDRDITIRAIAEGKDPTKTTVENTMSVDVITCKESDSITDVAQKMASEKVRRILVEGKDGKVAGVVSLGDIAIHADDTKTIANVLSEVSSS